MKSTKARKEFKDQFGQANHFLITSLVGLNTIETNPNIIKPLEFSTSWNPRDKVRSARRSRSFVLNSFLSFAVDGVDMYLTLLNRTPKVLVDLNFSLIFEKAKNSVYNKVLGVEEYFDIDKTLVSLILLLITWRNNLVHGLAENEIRNNYVEQLKKNQTFIKENFRGLLIDDTITRAYEGKYPNFKEVASLINATHMFVQEVDKRILEKMDKLAYAKDVIAFRSKKEIKSRTKCAVLAPKAKRRFLTNILLNYGSFENNDIQLVIEELL